MAKKVGELVVEIDVAEYGVEFKNDNDEVIVIDCNDDLGMAQTYASILEDSKVMTRKVMITTWVDLK